MYDNKDHDLWLYSGIPQDKTYTIVHTNDKVLHTNTDYYKIK